MAIFAMAALVASGCTSGSDVSASMLSDQRPAPTGSASPTDPGSTGTDPAPEPASPEFCERVRAFAAEAPGDSPEGLLEWLAQLRAEAPAQLVDDIDVLSGMVETLTSLEENDPASVGRVLETLLDPAAARATQALAEVALDECGVALEGGLGGLGATPGG
jgi:hypothetical protein